MTTLTGLDYLAHLRRRERRKRTLRLWAGRVVEIAGFVAVGGVCTVLLLSL